MIFFPLISFLIFAFVLYFVFRIRYDSSGRTLILKLLCSVQGIPSMVLKSNPKLCKAILDASDTKGHGVEMYFAFPGWRPIYNSESVDGERWKRLLSIFRRIMHKLDYNERLPALIEKHTKKICVEHDNIDSPAIQKLTCRIMFELLFSKEITPEDEALFVSATNEWRKHVAQKGQSSLFLKDRMVSRMLELVAESSLDGEGLREEFKADKYEMISSFMQPFLISPIINLSDIFCETSLLLDTNSAYQEQLRRLAAEDVKNDRENNGSVSMFLAVVYESLRLKHPFPILERELSRDVTDGKTTVQKGTHVFIELDSFIQSQEFKPENWFSAEYCKETSWILFTTGPRMCAGRFIALHLLEGMLFQLVRNKSGDFKKLRMWDKHKISGRRNDSTASFEEALFQVKALVSVFREAISHKK